MELADGDLEGAGTARRREAGRRTTGWQRGSADAEVVRGRREEAAAGTGDRQGGGGDPATRRRRRGRPVSKGKGGASGRGARPCWRRRGPDAGPSGPRRCGRAGAAARPVTEGHVAADGETDVSDAVEEMSGGGGES